MSERVWGWKVIIYFYCSNEQLEVTVTPYGYDLFTNFAKWFGAQPHPHKVVIAGIPLPFSHPLLSLSLPILTFSLSPSHPLQVTFKNLSNR